MALQKFTDGKKMVEVPGKTVGECIGALIRMFPELDTFLFDPKEDLKSYIGVYVNLKSAYPMEMDMPVSDSDKIHLDVIFSGG